MAKKIIEVDRPKNATKQARYSDKQKQKAVILYKMTGNAAATAAQIGVSIAQLRLWRQSDWWKELESELREQSRTELKGSLKGLVDSAFKQVQDRIDNGDWYYDQKKGEMIRKPLAAHAANQILKDSFDRTLALEKLASQEKHVETSEKITDRLVSLMDQFRKFSKAKEITTTYVELENTDALHEEREEGLQEADGMAIDSGTDSQAGLERPSSGEVNQGGEGQPGGRS
jgi:hypothetical protein